MPSLNLWREDRKLTAMMIEDMVFDPILATKVLLGLRVPPHEELRITTMWTHHFTSDDSGFSTGKSFTHAIISALRSILFPGRVSGIISKTMEQGKLIFQNFDRWYEGSPIFRWCIKHQGGKPRLVHGASAFQAFFRGGAEIRVLPPNFMQDAERLKSERWHDGYLDEWTSYGNFEALNKTVFGRISKDNEYPDCPIRQNHIHLSSTPSFEHHPCYVQIKRINQQIAAGNKDYARFSCNYRHVPDNKTWRFLISRKTILAMQISLPDGIVKSEVDGLWQKDSLSYYSSFDVSKVRFSTPQIGGGANERNVYIAAYDVARGGSGEQAMRQSGDDFSISIAKIDLTVTPHKPVHICTIRKNNVSAAQMCGIVHDVNRTFGCYAIGYDPGGGGLFVRDELKKKKALINNIETAVQPLVDIGDNTPFANPILIPIRRAFKWIDLMWGKMASESVLVNRIHSHMKQAIQSQGFLLAKPWDGWDIDCSQWDVDQKRQWLNRNTSLGIQDRIAAEMDLAVEQLIMVDVIKDENGVAQLDSHGMYKFKSKFKKDAAYSLIYLYLVFLIWQYRTANSRDNKGSGIADAISAAPI